MFWFMLNVYIDLCLMYVLIYFQCMFWCMFWFMLNVCLDLCLMYILIYVRCMFWFMFNVFSYLVLYLLCLLLCVVPGFDSKCTWFSSSLTNTIHESMTMKTTFFSKPRYHTQHFGPKRFQKCVCLTSLALSTS